MTLVEVVVALLVFSVCVAGLVGLVVTGRGLSEQARDHYTAINIAKNRLERGRSLEFGQLAQMAESSIVVDRSGLPSASGNFRRTTAVTAVRTNLFQVTVTVDIRDRLTLNFAGEREIVSTYLALYLEPQP